MKKLKPGTQIVSIKDIDLSEYYERKDKSVEDIKPSIEAFGVIAMPVISTDYKLRVGGRRLRVWKGLGNKKIRVDVSDKDELSQQLLNYDENTKRKSYTPFELSEVLKKYRDIEIERGNGYKYEQKQSKGKQGKQGKQRVKGLVKRKAKEMGLSESQTFKHISRAERAASSVKRAFKKEEIKGSIVDKIIQFSKKEQGPLLTLIQKKPKKARIQILNFALKNGIKKAALDVRGSATHPASELEFKVVRLNSELKNSMEDLVELKTYPPSFFKKLNSLKNRINEALKHEKSAPVILRKVRTSSAARLSY